MDNKIKKITGYAVILMAALLAQASFLTLGLFLFYGSFDLVNLNMGIAGSLIVDACLSALFFAQHSGMVRQKFRRWLSCFIGTTFHGAVFTIASALVLLMVVIFWRKIPIMLLSAHGMVRWFFRCAYFLIIAGFAWGAGSLQPFDPMGLSPVVSQLRGKQPSPMRLSIRGPYRWVRHPLYLFAVVMIWSCPDVTVDRLLFNVLWTGWIVTGAFLEERDLADFFGEAYLVYQQNVPMLIPKSFRPAE